LFVAKGIYDFLEMLRELHHTHVAFKAIIAGGEGDVTIDQVIHYTLKEGFNEKVEVLGSVTGAAKWDIFHSSNIFVLPSHNECFPLTILEAMSAGLPVIATRIGGVPDMIQQEQDGFIVEMKDTKALYESVRILCTNQALLELMSQNAIKKYTDLYTIQHFRENFMKMLDTYRGVDNQ
jgi:glycosyltransferase involved in cell wall biosynthesis